MPDPLQPLLESLLWEGYALYPYTPGATKNATPTPFGIVYPPAYAAECDGAFDHARMECLAERGAGASLTAELRFLQPTGGRHEAAERRLALGPTQIGQRETFHQEHQEIEDHLKMAQTVRNLKQARHQLLAAVVSSRKHFDKEERIVFPLAEKHLKSKTLTELCSTWTEHRNRSVG